ncbi:hypothetical protein VTK26DRAFT_6521 [Humicola hyalothermophila]
MPSQQQPIPTSQHFGAEIASANRALHEQTKEHHHHHHHSAKDTADTSSLVSSASTSTLVSQTPLLKDKLHQFEKDGGRKEKEKRDERKEGEPSPLTKEILSGQIRLGV